MNTLKEFYKQSGVLDMPRKKKKFYKRHVKNLWAELSELRLKDKLTQLYPMLSEQTHKQTTET